MSVRIAVTESGLYYITFTCLKWMPLFEVTKSYDLVYKWYDVLKKDGHYITAYVIMPNHLHAIIAFRNSGKSINKIVSNGKRFLAYGLVERLVKAGCDQNLDEMYYAVSKSDRKRGKIHQVFQPSFDCKACFTDRFMLQKLNYIHNNPCKGKWDLAMSPHLYEHSSARFYQTGIHGAYKVTRYTDISDVSLA